MNFVSIKNSASNKIPLHTIIWCFFISTSLIQFYESPYRISTDFYVQWITGIVLFYLNYIYLVTHFLLQKKYAYFIGIILLLIIIFMVFRHAFFIPEFREIRIQNGGNFPKIPYNNGNFDHRIHKREQPFFFKIVPSVFYLLIVAISTIIKILSEFYNDQQNKLIAESQRTATELNYLRTQTNPHFLFNSLNSIYSLAHKKSDLVPDAIVTLSEMMRYMLYETDNKHVLLEKEIDYIKNYIELQKLRLNNIENISINIHGNTKDKYIEPMLLISFIENAFKYGTDYKGTAYVKIVIKIEENIFTFWIENKIENIRKDPENSGIGLANIKNRLTLLYPNTHQLDLITANSNYTVNLVLQLDQIQSQAN
ncbi:sensor histidine kinase [Flavobacterium aquicola]|uniref:Histidine kinase n=1 Tax=Flavobacterium aquicola TaxID=1682742 RepID=A0A3E0ER71_9FLAO|nr:sensor histidine kinase [Flavobacterium aquicola]REH00231.1 histidine kinase [Flavobacterium aquicola]